jgi:uncharacterized protein involved in exopolysaccharide biosynthesis
MEFRESIDLDFRSYLAILKRRWVPAFSIFALTVIFAAFSTLFLKPLYEAEGKLLFKLDQTSSLTGLGEETGELKPLVSTDNPLNTEIEVIYSNRLLQKTIEALDLNSKQGERLETKNIKQRLSVKIIGGTDVLRLSYQSSDPEEAAAVVNKLMSVYIKNNILIEQNEAVSAREFIAGQLPFTETNVRVAEVALRRFKEKNNVVALSKEAESAVSSTDDLTSQITTVQAELDEANAQSTALRNTLNLNSQEARIVSALSQSPGLQKVLEELQGVERQLAIQQSKFQEQSPTIVSLKERKASLETLLQKQTEQLTGSQAKVPDKLLQINSLVGENGQNLIIDFLKSEVQRFSLARRLASLEKSRSNYVQRANILPRLEQEQRELERRLEASQSTYENLLNKLQEVQVAQKKDISNVRIIDPAVVPKTPLVGAKAKILALGVLLGAFLSTSSIFFLEMGDKSFKKLK